MGEPELRCWVPGPVPRAGVNLAWGAGDRLVFLANMDNWPHLYSVPAAGGAEPMLLTPGNFMVEFVTMSPDKRFVVYNANTGTETADDDRRHLFKVPVDAGPASAADPRDGYRMGGSGEGDGRLGACSRVELVALHSLQSSSIDGGETPETARRRPDIPRDFPAFRAGDPERVVIPSIDGLPVHLQLFKRSDLGPGSIPPSSTCTAVRRARCCSAITTGTTTRPTTR
jgi:hypothetical protein